MGTVQIDKTGMGKLVVKLDGQHAPLASFIIASHFALWLFDWVLGNKLLWMSRLHPGLLQGIHGWPWLAGWHFVLRHLSPAYLFQPPAGMPDCISRHGIHRHGSLARCGRCSTF